MNIRYYKYTLKGANTMSDIENKKEEKEKIKKIRIFKSKIFQKNGTIDAIQLFKDIEIFITDQQKNLPLGTRLDRGHPLQSILNKTSGNYISSTAMHSFEMCPASYLYSKLVKERTGYATSVGRTFHTIMEKFYNTNPKGRTKERIYEVMEETIIEDEQQDSAKDVKAYVDGYWNADDYLGGKMDHEALICSNEVFIKPTINPLGINLGVPVYELLDRIDIREDGIYTVDYKTGFGDPNPYNLGEHGYLPQMILSKWAIEAEYGQELKKAFLCLPGAASASCNYVEMNVNSLVEQSKVVENIHSYIKYAKSIRESKQFPAKLMRYCVSCQMKTFCSVFIKAKGLDETDVKEEIDVEIEVEI